MAPPVDTFTDLMKQWVRRKYTSSIVLVELRPRCAAAVKDLWGQVSPILGEGFAEIDLERAELCRINIRATGFVVIEQGDTGVLTCAHLLANLFSNTFPISAEQIEDLYEVFILCDHVEQRFLRERVNNPQLQRDYTPAQVGEVDCRTDLMLLWIRTADLQARCGGHRHTVVPVAEKTPSPLVDVVMLSWPWEGSRTAVAGLTSHPGRAHNVLVEDDDHGYEMELSEVDIASDFGSSGAPLIGLPG